MKDNITPQKYKLDNVTVVNGFDITSDIIDKCINQIDKVYYPKSTTDPESIKSWVLDHSEFCFVMIDNSSSDVMGYLYCFPTTEDCTIEYLKGSKTFKDLNNDSFDDLVGAGIYNLYIASLGLRDEFHNGYVRRLLFECFVNQVIEFAKRDMFINYIYMEIASKFEKEICHLFNLEKLSDNILKREMFGGMLDLKRFIKLDNYLALEAVYSTIHAKEILKFRHDYTKLIKSED